MSDWNRVRSTYKYGNNDFFSFMSNMFGGTNAASSISSLISPLLGIGVNLLGNFAGSRLMNSSLTGKEREQNAFNAQQAQVNREYQTEMSNTAYQRGVADMQAAGLNPALMYGNGSAASTPTGSNAQGSASVVQSPLDFIAAITALKGLQADISLKKSQESVNYAKADEAGASAGLIVQNTRNATQEFEKTREVIAGLKLDNWRKEILNQFAYDKEQAELDNLKQSKAESEKRIEQMDTTISKMSAEQQAIFQGIMESYSRIRLNNSAANLNDENAIKVSYECSEVEERTNKLVEEVAKTKEEREYLRKEIKWYGWNHGSEMSGFGLKPGVKFVPKDKDLAHGG